MIGSSAKLKQLLSESVEFRTTTDIIKLAANLQGEVYTLLVIYMALKYCPASVIMVNFDSELVLFKY